MANLTEKYRLIWDASTFITLNDYKRDYTGSTSIIVNNGDIDFIQSEIYQDIVDKISELELKDPSINEDLINEDPIIPDI